MEIGSATEYADAEVLGFVPVPLAEVGDVMEPPELFVRPEPDFEPTLPAISEMTKMQPIAPKINQANCTPDCCEFG